MEKRKREGEEEEGLLWLWSLVTVVVAVYAYWGGCFSFLTEQLGLGRFRRSIVMPMSKVFT